MLRFFSSLLEGTDGGATWKRIHFLGCCSH